MKILKIAKVGLITGTLGYECHGGMSVGDDKVEEGRMWRRWRKRGRGKGRSKWRSKWKK